VAHRHEIVTRRTTYEHKQATKRLHLLQGYMVALDNLDAILQLIKAAHDPQVAQQKLIQDYELSELQAKAILEMRLQRLTGLEREKVVEEHTETEQKLAQLTEVLTHKELRMSIIKEELVGIASRYPSPRKTKIIYEAADLEMEDM